MKPDRDALARRYIGWRESGAKWGNLRAWQTESLRRWHANPEPWGVYTVIMGAGKTLLSACMAIGWPGRVCLSVPTQRLVRDTRAELEAMTGEPIGVYYAHERVTDCRITIVCAASMPRWLEEMSGPRQAPLMEVLTEVLQYPVPGEGWLWVSDECHRTEGGYFDRAATVPWSQCVGLSATPYLSDSKSALRLWRHEIMRHDIMDALAAGELVPPRFIMPDSRFRGMDVETYAVVVASELERGNGLGVISATSINTASELAGRICATGVRAVAIHSELTKAAMAQVMARVDAGEIDVIVHVRMLVEGVNMPAIQWMALTRDRSRVDFSQEIGRGIRSYPSKTECRIYDPLGGHLRHRIQDMASLGAALSEAPDRASKDREPVEVLIDPHTGEPFEVTHGKAEAKRVRVRDRAWNAISQIVATAATAGIAEQTAGVGRWRSEAASERQVAAVRKASRWARAVASRHGDGAAVSECEAAHFVARMVVRTANKIENGSRKGTLSDLLSACSLTLWSDDATRSRLTKALVTFGVEIPKEAEA